MKPNLLILTNNFPNAPLTSEGWLANEIVYSHSFFNSIYILPEINVNKNLLNFISFLITKYTIYFHDILVVNHEIAFLV